MNQEIHNGTHDINCLGCLQERASSLAENLMLEVVDGLNDLKMSEKTYICMLSVIAAKFLIESMKAVSQISGDDPKRKKALEQYWPNYFYSLGLEIEEKIGIEPFKVTDFSSVRLKMEEIENTPA